MAEPRAPRVMSSRWFLVLALSGAAMIVGACADTGVTIDNRLDQPIYAEVWSSHPGVGLPDGVGTRNDGVYHGPISARSRSSLADLERIAKPSRARRGLSVGLWTATRAPNAAADIDVFVEDPPGGITVVVEDNDAQFVKVRVVDQNGNPARATITAANPRKRPVLP